MPALGKMHVYTDQPAFLAFHFIEKNASEYRTSEHRSNSTLGNIYSLVVDRNRPTTNVSTRPLSRLTKSFGMFQNECFFRAVLKFCITKRLFENMINHMPSPAGSKQVKHEIS